MIVLCGIPSEPPLRLVAQAAQRQGIETLIINQRQALQTSLAFSFEAQQGVSPNLQGELRTPEQAVDLHEISGVYVRLMDFQELPEYQAPEITDQAERNQRQRHITSLHQVLVDWLEVAPQRVMNRLSRMGSNQSKPYQAQLIAQAGFLIPPTLVTNDPELVQAFIDQHGRLIYKSISAQRSVVQELTRSRWRALEKIRHLPTQFQAYIPGENLRVHVVGEQVFSSLIETPAVDYRYASQEQLEIQIKKVYIEREIEESCHRLAALLHLPLCGIDLKRTPAGEVYCFEVNPSPAFSYYQEHTGQDMAAAIASYLAG